MPCCYLTLRARKPRNKAYPINLKTLGDHIRKRRLDLGPHQKDVAALVNTATSTITNWEKGRATPRLYLLPKVVEFLSYFPFESNATTIGEKIKQYRIQNGLSFRKLAKELGIDPGTLARWERGESEPCGKLKSE
ncbi:MAG: helix-turn-helix transcriptional regulator [Ignavibacteria bacterium]|nr:helix-turn-helix transcriptional regulator [Ignavibacteria bacterium]